MAEQRTVWDILVRVLHWSLVAGITIAWITEDGPGILHDGAGYAVLIVIAIRLIWGLVGTKFARFTSFVRSPSSTLNYVKSVGKRTEPRHLGHNPLGGWMILALLACATATGATGWLYITDTFWGLDWMEEVHESFANLLLILIALHVVGVVFTSLLQRENLAAAMTHGRKEIRPGDQE